MKLRAFFLCVLVAVVALVWSAGLQQQEESANFSLDERALPLFHGMPHKRSSSLLLKTHKYVNCGTPENETVNLSKVIFSTDPVAFPGMLKVEFEAQVKSLIDSPLKANVTLEKKRSNGEWVKIPCISQIGSCVYEDVCQLLSQLSDCPDSFKEEEIPCRCPFEQSAKTRSAEFQVDVAYFTPGEYQAIANLTANGQPVACIQLFVTFE